MKDSFPYGKKTTGDEKCRTVVPNTSGKNAQPTELCILSCSEGRKWNG